VANSTWLEKAAEPAKRAFRHGIENNTCTATRRWQCDKCTVVCGFMLTDKEKEKCLRTYQTD